MTRKNLNALFIEYCKAVGLTIQQSNFNKERKYITAQPGTVYLGQSDPRAGNNFAIIQNGENGTVSAKYGYVPAERLYGYMEGTIECCKTVHLATKLESEFEHPEFESDLSSGKFDLSEYDCTIHKTQEQPENWQLTIYTDIQAGDIETIYHYDSEGEAENDLRMASKHYRIPFNVIS